MKQFRDTPIYCTKEGEIFRKIPAKTSTYKNRTVINGKEYFRDRIVKYPERWNKPKIQPHNGGYHQIVYSVNDKSVTHTVHRIIAECYLPGYFEGAEVDHIDCDKTNNHISNLQWCTPEYNRVKK